MNPIDEILTRLKRICDDPDGETCCDGCCDLAYAVELLAIEVGKLFEKEGAA